MEVKLHYLEFLQNKCKMELLLPSLLLQVCKYFHHLLLNCISNQLIDEKSKLIDKKLTIRVFVHIKKPAYNVYTIQGEEGGRAVLWLLKEILLNDIASSP